MNIILTDPKTGVQYEVGSVESLKVHTPKEKNAKVLKSFRTEAGAKDYIKL